MTESFSSSSLPPAGKSSNRYSIEASHLVKRYGNVLAADHVSFQVHRGEFFSLLGPSGAGKTSILRMLAGFETADAGTLLIEGQSMDNVPPNLRPVNLVFQSYALFPHLRVGENVAFGLEMKRVSRSEIQARVRDALEMVKLLGKEERWPHELSGGEQQRVALARALVNRPAVLLLDEPLSALDQQLRQEMQIELKAIQEQVGSTFVCVTHHQHEAMTMSDRIGVMHHGRLVQIGTPREIYERPANLFVARFIGISNELPGRIEAVRNGMGIMASDLEKPVGIQVSCPESVSRPQRVILSLRPEQLFLSSDESRLPAVANVVAGRVDKILYGGHETEYVIRLSEAVIWRVPLNNLDRARKPFVPGESVYIGWHAGEGTIFPSEPPQ
ncbi:MAG: ABC transporter ATP-binding protein [Nitrospiraceae bacterium]